MTHTNRAFHACSDATGIVTISPIQTQGEGSEDDTFESTNEWVSFNAVQHASLVMYSRDSAVYVDPVGEHSWYSRLPAPDIVLITHEHSDHFDIGLLEQLVPRDSTAKLVTNRAVFDNLPEYLKRKAEPLDNGGTANLNGVFVEAIPAYNTTADRRDFHPQGRDNGYLVVMKQQRIYISGDTEDIPEMRALENIHVCFLCMNSPFTMDVAQAASAVREFKPQGVTPYHYRNRDGSYQNLDEFERLVDHQSMVVRVPFYRQD